MVMVQYLPSQYLARMFKSFAPCPACNHETFDGHHKEIKRIRVQMNQKQRNKPGNSVYVITLSKRNLMENRPLSQQDHHTQQAP